MRHSLPVLLVVILAGTALAEVGTRSDVPMDRVPWERAHPNIERPDWWEVAHIPAGHPYWWSLADVSSPLDLPSAMKRHVTMLEREATAIDQERRAAGASSTARSDSNGYQFTISGKTHPELFPLWDVFGTFAARFDYGWTEEHARAKLLAYGLTETGANQVLTAAARVAVRTGDLQTEITADAIRFEELRRTAETKAGQKITDLRTLARLSGESEESVADLVRRKNRSIPAEAAVPVLVELRPLLGEEQWGQLRDFLSREIVSGMALGISVNL